MITLLFTWAACSTVSLAAVLWLTTRDYYPKELSSEELFVIEDLETRCVASIEGQNWTDIPLTEEEKHVIGMAVSWTYHELTRRKS